MRDEWFRIQDPATENLRKEIANARALNAILMSKVSNLKLKNLAFLDPLEVLGSTCGSDLASYQKCFRDRDHMTDESASKIISHILKNILLYKANSNTSQ